MKDHFTSGERLQGAVKLKQKLAQDLATLKLPLATKLLPNEFQKVPILYCGC